MVTYSVLEAKNSFSRVVNQAASGERVIITKRGEPVAQLLPFGDGKRPFTGSALVEWIGATSHHRSRSTEDIEARIADAQGDWD